MQLKSVVFPEPLGPMSPRILPCSAEHTTSLSAASPPKNLKTCLISSRATEASHQGLRRGRQLPRAAGDELLGEPQHAVGHEQDHHHHQDAVNQDVGVSQVLLEEAPYRGALLYHSGGEQQLGQNVGA